jgi:hypothetical protein
MKYHKPFQDSGDLVLAARIGKNLMLMSLAELLKQLGN